jgi:hypothetical protein
MARRISRRSHEQTLMQNWGVRVGLAAAFLLLSYGFASLAIDSGNFLEYAATIAALWYAVHNGIRAFRLAVFS